MKKRILTSTLLAILILAVNYSQTFASIIDVPLPEAPLNQRDKFQTNLFTGSAEYSYPIKVPQGTNNLTPDVTLSYDSNATHGLVSRVGGGWEINQNYIQRDVNNTPTDTSDDKYKLHFNGQTYDLVYNPTDSLFHTKIESHLKIQQFLSGGQGTTGIYWQVTATNGTVYRFGYLANAELLCNTQTYDAYWNVDQVTDTYGNNIYYTYTSSSGDSYLSTIKYNNDQQREIDFNYVSNPYQRQLYIQGCLTTETQQLNNIQVKAHSNLVHEYDLSYTTSVNSQPLLQSITEKGSDGSALPPTTFNYKPEVQTWPSTYIDWAYAGFPNNFYNSNVFLLDVNGDGYPDVVRATSNGGYDNYYIYKNNGGAFTGNAETWVNNVNMDAMPSEYWTRFIDMNNDGLPDIVKATADTWYVWKNTGTGWNPTPEIWASNSTVPGFTSTNNDVMLADVNGDGLPDVVKTTAVSGPYTTIQVWLNTGTSFSTTPQTWVNDANMDTKIDQSNVTLIDVNGDGLPDWVKSVNNGGPNNEWEVWLNTGHSWDTNMQIWDNPIDANLDSTETGLIDVNGDGLPDIVRSVNLGGANNEWRVFLNNGNGWASTYIDWATNIDTNIDNTNESRMADINGDGLTDLVRVVNINNDPNTNEWRVWTNNGYAPDLLSTIHNSLGGSTSFEYTPSTHYPNNGANSTPNLPYPMWVVSKMTVDNGMTNAEHTSDVTTYSYKNGVYNGQAQEFRGFGEVDETDPNGAKKQTFFNQDDALKGTMSKQITTDASGNPYTETDDTWSSSLSNSIYTNTLTSEKKYTYDGSSTNPKITETDYQYDQYGNVTKQSDLGDTAVTGDEKFTYKQYTYNTSLWILDNPYDTYVNGPDDATKVSETWDYYDNNLNLTDAPTKGDITKEVKWLSGLGATNPTTTYAYDSYGNKTQETDANNHSTTWSYGTNDTTHTYPDSTTNAKNQTTTMTFDLGTGNQLTKTDPNGFTTSYSYDPFGRIKTEVDPYDTTSFPTKSYTYFDNTSAPQGTLVSQRQVSGQTGTLDSYAFVDGLGRKIQSRTSAEDTSKQIVVDTFYDPTGKVAQESVPHLDTLSTAYATPLTGIENTVTTYDPIARVIQVTNPQGTSSTTSYNHWSQTDIDENDHQKTKIMDAYNNILEVDEYNSGLTYRTTYVYDPLNNLTKITDANNNIFTFTYDTLGRKTAESDPDMGTWHYTYDGVDNLLTKTDNRGKTTTKTYDELNRVLTVSYPTDPTTTYTYDGNSKIGTLTSVTDAAGTVSYQYDNRLRKTQEQRVTDGITWTTSYAYDAANRVTSTTKPDGEIVAYAFNAQGEVASVSGVLNNVDYNALDKVIDKTYANGLTTNYTYNTTDFRLNRIQTGTVQDIGYTYDNVGNVKSTTDNLLSKTQSFGYDALDRLTTASESAGYNYTYAYDAIGNLTSFSSPDTQSSYTYGQNTLVHAVTNVTSTTMIYDEALAYGWTDASFNTTNATTTTNFYSGATALSSTIGANGGLDFQAPRLFSSGSYDYVHFALKASQPGQQYDVYADSTFGQALSAPVSLANYGGQPTANGWTVYNIPLSALGAANVPLSDIVIHNPTGSNEPAVYVDQVELMSGVAPTPIPTATPTPGPTATPTPTNTSIQLDGTIQTTYSGGSDITLSNFPVTGTNSNRFLLVAVGSHQGGGTTTGATGITYGGAPMTLLASQVGQYGEFVQLWGLQAPAGGTANIATSGISGGDFTFLTAYSLYNVKQTYTIQSGALSQGGNSSSVSITPNSANNWIIDAIEAEPLPTVAGTNIQDWAQDGAPNSYDNGNGSRIVQSGGPATVSMAWNLSYGARSNQVAVALEPTASGPAPTATPTPTPGPTATPTPTPPSGFSDNFTTSSMDTTKWQYGIVDQLFYNSSALDLNVPITQANQQMTISLLANQSNYHFNGYLSKTTWDMTNKQASVEVVQSSSGTSTNTTLALTNDQNNWYRIVTQSGNIYFQQMVAGTKSSVSIAYNPTQQLYWRIRHSSSNDTIYWETSPDGTTWTTQQSAARQLPITAMTVSLNAGTFQSDSNPGSAIFAKFLLQ